MSLEVLTLIRGCQYCWKDGLWEGEAWMNSSPVYRQMEPTAHTLTDYKTSVQNEAKIKFPCKPVSNPLFICLSVSVNPCHVEMSWWPSQEFQAQKFFCFFSLNNWAMSSSLYCFLLNWFVFIAAWMMIPFQWAIIVAKLFLGVFQTCFNTVCFCQKTRMFTTWLSWTWVVREEIV